ncbi:MAG: archease [Anaerolineales bacterium]|nr:archease [Anaerolineales bacterium]
MYTEVEHTADYSVQLSAENLPGLFIQAVQAVQVLSGVEAGDTKPCQRKITLKASDLETLLVVWLEELLYSLEIDRLAWQPEDVTVDGCVLQADVQVFPVKRIQRFIKAVTFHRLEVSRKADRWEAAVVFDV